LEPRVTVSVLVASGQIAQITYHLNRAMDNGSTKEQAGEVVAESIVRLLYDFFYGYLTILFSIAYIGGGGGSRTRVRKCY